MIALITPLTERGPANSCVPVPFTSKFPETVRSSSTVTVPPKESIVRLPAEVSISLVSVTPILIYWDRRPELPLIVPGLPKTLIALPVN